MNKRRKTGMFSIPQDEAELRRKIEDFVMLLGADQSGLNTCQKINKSLNDNKHCNWIESWRFMNIFCRKWIYHFLDEDEKQEADTVTDEDIKVYFGKCGAKHFHHWFPRIRARADGALSGVGQYSQFYDDSNEDPNKNVKRKKKQRKRKKRRNVINDNNNVNANDSDPNRFNVQHMDDSDDLEDLTDSNSSDDDNEQDEDDDFQQLQRRKQKKLFKKRNKSSQEDMVTLIIATQYNKAGLDSDKMMQWLRAFCKCKDLKITDLRSCDQIDKRNVYLPHFVLKHYFQYFTDAKRNDAEKLIIQQLADKCFALLGTKYVLEVLPKGLNNQIFALINNNTKPAEMYDQLIIYLDEAKKEDKSKMSFAHISKPLICIEKAISGVCPDVNCKKNHNACMACWGPHRTGECRSLSWKVRKMVSANHSFNWKNFKRFNNNNNNNWNNRNNRNQNQYNKNYNNRYNNNQNNMPNQQNNNNQNQPNRQFNANLGNWQWIPFNNNNNNQNNNPNNQNNQNGQNNPNNQNRN